MSEIRNLGLQRRRGRRPGPTRPAKPQVAGCGQVEEKGGQEQAAGIGKSKTANNVLECISKIVGFGWLCLKLLGFFVAQT
jgi:hypothetical protein